MDDWEKFEPRDEKADAKPDFEQGCESASPQENIDEFETDGNPVYVSKT
jgi:hypothetical protein